MDTFLLHLISKDILWAEGWWMTVEEEEDNDLFGDNLIKRSSSSSSASPGIANHLVKWNV